MDINEDKLNIIVKKILNETYDHKKRYQVVKSAYNQIVNAVKGFGTNPNQIDSAIKKLQNSGEFETLKTLFKDKRSGYSDFAKMINSEYDYLNYGDAKRLQTSLRKIGVNAQFNTDNANLVFKKGFKILGYITKKKCYMLPDCKNKWNQALKTAVKFWKDWLTDPVTKNKVQLNWDTWYMPGKFQMAYYYPKYMDVLSNIKLKFYDCNVTSIDGHKPAHDAVAYVIKSNNKTIYVNCSSNDKDFVDTLIHELQHVIYNIKPLNPEKRLTSLFVKKNTPKETARQIINGLLTTKAKKSKVYSQDVLDTAKKLNISPGVINTWKKEMYEWVKQGEKDYLCEETEKMSNIIAIRKLFNIKPGQNITLQMLIPYIKKQKNHTDVYWYLMCWASKGFPDINQLINRTNELAAQGLKSPENVA